MLWAFISLLVILGLGAPILQRIYGTFLNTDNGSWQNWTTTNSTLTGSNSTYYDYEFATFQFIPLLAVLFAVAFILAVLGMYFRNRGKENET